MKARILVVEDEEKLRRVIELQLQSAGHEVQQARTAEDALPLSSTADLILTDLRLPGMDGLAFLEQLRKRSVSAPVIVMTAFGTVEGAVQAMKAGAADFLPKPFSMDHLMTVVDKTLEVRNLREENSALRQQLGGRYDFANIIGSSPPMIEILDTVRRIAPKTSTVLLQGESGVGKDLVARAIHYQSPRRSRPFVKISCTAIPEHLMESELFGYEKGAFTGATQAKPGKFEQADTGTVFLDEIGDVPLQIQVKLLRVIQEREFERLGSNKSRVVDVRVIAATNADLRKAITNGTFREDLYYRLNVVPLLIPPLRERRSDIRRLVERFVHKYTEELGSAVSSITEAAMEVLIAHDWPGNVRQLENVIERSVLLCEGTTLDAADIKLDRSTSAPPQAGSTVFLPEGVTLDEHERALIREALHRASGNKSHAARLLGLSRNALRYRLTQMGIES